jgi:hypothetical protein
MEISVEGWRASPSDWSAVRSVPRDQLPALTEEQREVAKKLGIAEEDYARSVLAGQRTSEALLGKTERLGRLLNQRLKAIREDASVERVSLSSTDHRFDVTLIVKEQRVPLRIDENLVDDYFDGGSLQADEALGRVLERTLAVSTQ